MSFTDLGIPIDAVESRTAAICIRADGQSRVVIAAKGFLVIVNPMTEQCVQLDFPDGHTEYPYDCFSSSNGMFYVGAGVMFYAVDPFELRYVDTIQISERDELLGFSYAENGEGHIYVASYPDSRLYRYRPQERDLTEYGSMDPDQKYPSSMAADAYGWVYIGLGTTRRNIVAYHPASGQRHAMLGDPLRTIGHGKVRQAADHQAYIQVNEGWARVEQGMAIEQVEDDQLPASLYTGESFDKFYRQLDGEWRVVRHSLSRYELVLRHTQSAVEKVIKLTYQSVGATLSTLVVGPDKQIYGTSMHPLHFYRFDPQHTNDGDPAHGIGKAMNYGPTVIEHGAGGNIAAYAVQGSRLLGAAYPGGRLHVYDVSKPIQLEPLEAVKQVGELAAGGITRNPICVASNVEIHRPRCAVALRDQEHVVYGGFPDYGMVGGGLCVYHLPTGTHRLIPHTALIPEQSTVSLIEAADGVLIGGTSIETPGGAMPKAHHACLYEWDWKEGIVRKSWMIHDDIREYSLLLQDAAGRIHTMTACCRYLVWDSVQEALVHEVDLSAWGKVVRAGWVLCDEEACIYGVMGEAIFRIPLDSLQPERIAVPPGEITAGFAMLNNAIYFGSSTHLWQYSI